VKKKCGNWCRGIAGKEDKGERSGRGRGEERKRERSEEIIGEMMMITYIESFFDFSKCFYSSFYSRSEIFQVFSFIDWSWHLCCRIEIYSCNTKAKLCWFVSQQKRARKKEGVEGRRKEREGRKEEERKEREGRREERRRIVRRVIVIIRLFKYFILFYFIF
jgi:hypothetical protein